MRFFVLKRAPFYLREGKWEKKSMNGAVSGELPAQLFYMPKQKIIPLSPALPSIPIVHPKSNHLTSNV
jgi:hypothetical protein